MSATLHTPREPSLTGTIADILDGFRTLIRQQVDLVKAEVRSDLQKARDAIWPVAAGAVLAAVSVVPFSLTLVHLLHWATSPAGTDPATLPLWSCYGIVGAALALTGAGLAWFGVSRLRELKSPFNESARALKENVKWLTHER